MYALLFSAVALVLTLYMLPWLRRVFSERADKLSRIPIKFELGVTLVRKLQ